MKLSTICYIEQDDKYLMLHRIKKHQDVNEGKWIGVGGKMEAGESPDECIAREVLEETGLTLVQPRLRGIITFISAGWDDELIFLYTGQAEGTMLPDCDEGILRWCPSTKWIRSISGPATAFSCASCAKRRIAFPSNYPIRAMT